MKSLKALVTCFVLLLQIDCQRTSDLPAPGSGTDVGDTVSKTSQKYQKDTRPLRFSVAAVLGPERTYDAYKSMFSYLSAKLEKPFLFIQRRTYQEINDLLIKAQVDLAFVCSGAFAVLPADAPVAILAAPVIDGRKTYRSFIITRNNLPFKSFSDLRDKKFAFTDPLSNSGYYYPMRRVVDLKENSQRFFAQTIFTGSHDKSIIAVFRHLVDAAAVDSIVYQQMVHPQSRFAKHLRIIEKSPDFAIPPVVVPTSIDPNLRANLLDILLKLHHDKVGKKLLEALTIDRFDVIEEHQYDSIRQMINLVRKGGA